MNAVSSTASVTQTLATGPLPPQRVSPVPTHGQLQSHSMSGHGTSQLASPAVSQVRQIPQLSASAMPMQKLEAMPLPNRQGPQRLRHDAALEVTSVTQPAALPPSLPSELGMLPASSLYAVASQVGESQQKDFQDWKAATLPPIVDLSAPFSFGETLPQSLPQRDCTEFEMGSPQRERAVSTSPARTREIAEPDLCTSAQQLAKAAEELSARIAEVKQEEVADSSHEDQSNKPPPLSMSLTRPPPELPQQLLSEYEGDPELLGEGAFAVVSKLRHRRTGEWVALKVVEKYPLHIRDMLPQLQREVRIQGALVHKHILRLVSVLEDDAYVYMLLEYCAGGSLRSLCMNLPQHRLPEAKAAWFFAQILQGVEFMHQKNCVHRDLKPENMLLTAENEVRICDFGWSAEVQAEQALMTTCGTPHYWAPEIFEGQPQGTPVDLWSLGTLVYEILVGHAPFWGSMEELRAKVLAVDIRYPPGLLSNEAINLFYCLMQYDPRNRLSTTRILAEHPWVSGAVAALASGSVAPPGSIVTMSSEDVAMPGIPTSPASPNRGLSSPRRVMADESEGSHTVAPIGTSSSISAQESAVAAAMAAAAATAAAKSAVNAERWSGPLANPVWSTGPSNGASGAKALSAVVVPRGIQAEAPVVAPAVRPATSGRGSPMALSAALTSPSAQQPPLAVVATAESHNAYARAYSASGEHAVTQPGAIDWHTPEKASPSRSPPDALSDFRSESDRLR